jgi:hypothetical protein
MLTVAEPPELHRLKYASPLSRAPTYFKWCNPLVCQVSARYNHGSQDRCRFPSHEGEFTITAQLITFNLQIFMHCYKPGSNIRKLIHTVFKLTSITACPNSQWKEKFSRLHTSQRRTPSLAQGLVSLRRVTAGRGWVPLHRPAKRKGR